MLYKLQKCKSNVQHTVYGALPPLRLILGWWGSLWHVNLTMLAIPPHLIIVYALYVTLWYNIYVPIKNHFDAHCLIER